MRILKDFTLLLFLIVLLPILVIYSDSTGLDWQKGFDHLNAYNIALMRGDVEEITYITAKKDISPCVPGTIELRNGIYFYCAGQVQWNLAKPVRPKK